MMSSGKLTIIGALALVGIAVFLVREPVLCGIGDFLVVRDELQPADLIHVIAGPDEFTDYAFGLYKRGYGKRIFFTGGWCSVHQQNHGDRARDIARRRGVPPEALATDDSPVTSTYSEVEKLKDFIGRSGQAVRSVIAVGYPHHMWRARWTYRRILGDTVQLRMAPIPFEASPFKRFWWMDRDSRRMVSDEYLKILYYYARYKFAWGSAKEWLATLDRS